MTQFDSTYDTIDSTCDTFDSTYDTTRIKDSMRRISSSQVLVKSLQSSTLIQIKINDYLRYDAGISTIYYQYTMIYYSIDYSTYVMKSMQVDVILWEPHQVLVK